MYRGIYQEVNSLRMDGPIMRDEDPIIRAAKYQERRLLLLELDILFDDLRGAAYNTVAEDDPELARKVWNFAARIQQIERNQC